MERNTFLRKRISLRLKHISKPTPNLLGHSVKWCLTRRKAK